MVLKVVLVKKKKKLYFQYKNYQKHIYMFVIWLILFHLLKHLSHQ